MTRSSGNVSGTEWFVEHDAERRRCHDDLPDVNRRSTQFSIASEKIGPAFYVISKQFVNRWIVLVQVGERDGQRGVKATKTPLTAD